MWDTCDKFLRTPDLLLHLLHLSRSIHGSAGVGAAAAMGIGAAAAIGIGAAAGMGIGAAAGRLALFSRLLPRHVALSAAALPASAPPSSPSSCQTDESSTLAYWREELRGHALPRHVAAAEGKAAAAGTAAAADLVLVLLAGLVLVVLAEGKLAAAGLALVVAAE